MSTLAVSLVLGFFLGTPQSAPAPKAEDEYRPSLVAVDLRRADLADLGRLGLDVVKTTPELAHLVCDADERALLRTNRIPFRIVQEDLVTFYQKRLEEIPPTVRDSRGAWLDPPFGQGSMGGYYTWDEIQSVLDQIHAAYPSITTAKFSIGKSIQGRDLWAIKVSDNPDVDESEPEARIDALHHAREPASMQATIWALLALVEDYGQESFSAYLVDNRETWFIPCVNPDGYVHNQNNRPDGGGMWRKNRRLNDGGSYGVDLNRNYSYMWGCNNSGSSENPHSHAYRGTDPASEPEVEGMETFISSRKFITAISAHTYADAWLYPWGYTSLPVSNRAQYDELSALQTEINGYPYGSGSTVMYPANGVTIDYDHGEHGTMSWTPEIGGSGDGFWPETGRIIPLSELNELAFLRTILAAGAYLRMADPVRVEVGDGDGAFEAGETVELRHKIRNSGRGDPSTPVTLTLTSTSPNVTITRGSVSLGVVGSFTTVDAGATPLAFSIDAGTPPGTEIPYTTTLEHDGHVQAVDGVIVSD